MCDTCGCGGDDQSFKIQKPDQNNKNHKTEKPNDNDGHAHSHGDGHSHSHNHDSETLNVSSPVLNKNNLLAERNRGYFEAKNIKAFNMVSSPGSGKTSLLESLICYLKKGTDIAVIEGDQQTLNDAERIVRAGARAIQINTGNGCHLDAEMIHKAVKELSPSSNSILFIENVGNLVCPAMFDLGENARIIIISVTEGDDKPLKYPNMFETSHLCIINKMDLLPHVNFNIDQFKKNALQINHHLEFIEISATKHEGVEKVIDWIKA